MKQTTEIAISKSNPVSHLCTASTSPNSNISEGIKMRKPALFQSPLNLLILFVLVMKINLGFDLIFGCFSYAQQIDPVKEEMFKHAREALERARESDVPLLSPNNFNKASELYRTALQDYEKGEKLSQIRESLNRAQEHIEAAFETTRLSRIVLEHLIQMRQETRELELQEDAATLFSEAEWKFREAAMKIEDGDINLAKAIAREAEQEYRKVTIEILNNDVLIKAREKLKDIEGKVPAESFRSAAAELEETEAFIEAQKNAEFGIAELNAEVNGLVNHALFLVGEQMTMAELPDLLIEALGLIPESSGEGESVVIRAVVRNTGERPVGRVSVLFSDFDRRELGHAIIQYLEPRQTEEVRISSTTPDAGNWQITVRVDPENLVEERNEQNNEMERDFTITSTRAEKPEFLPPWWTKKLVIAYENFEQVEPEGWQFSPGVELEPARQGRLLRIEVNARAVWQNYNVVDARLDFRFQFEGGNGIIKLRQSETLRGEQAYVLKIGQNGVTLIRQIRKEQQILASSDQRLNPGKWYDVTIWLEGGRILVLLDNMTVLRAEDVDPLPAGFFSFSGENANRMMYASIRLFSAPDWMTPIPFDPDMVKAQDKILETDVWKGPFTTPDKLLQPDVWKGPIYGLKEVPLTVKPYLAKNHQLSPIDPGIVPPHFVHTWGIDIKGFNSFKLNFSSANNLVLHWLDGDILTVVDSWGQTVGTFTSQTQVEQKVITIKPTNFDSGQPYVRFYIMLETSSLDKPRKFKMLGFLNNSSNTGAEEALLVADDLNYDWKLGDFFETPTDKISQPWLIKGKNTSPFSDPPPQLKPRDAWYLLGKNTEIEEQGFLILAYYNEWKSRLRAYLFNLNLDPNASGYAVKFALRGRTTTAFKDLEGAFFPLDPRPQRWDESQVLIPVWPKNTWAFIEIPMLYPMARALPAKAGSPVSNLPAHWYDSIYEDNLQESMHNILLRVAVVPYFKGKLKGDIVGQAIGEAIQKINGKANNGIGPSIEEIMKGAYDAFSKGKDFFDKGKDFFKTINDFYEKQKKAGATNLQPLENLVKLGAGGWGGAFAAVGAGMSIYESFFSDPEPMQLAIELAIRATMTGSVFTEYQPAFHEFYLPGRFSIQDAFNSDQHSKMPKLVNAAIPRYDRTLGHIGYRYDPGTLEFRVLRRDCSQSQPDYDKGAFEEYPSQWDWFTSYYFPTIAKPVTTYPLYQACPGYTQWMDLSVNAKPPKIDKLLPIIYNPYAEITPMKPTIVKTIKKTPPQNFEDDRQWFWWIHDISWKTHITPESDDQTFPIKAVTEGDGPAIHVRVFNGNAGHATAKGFIKDCSDPSGRKGLVSAKGVGVLLDVKPVASCVPGTYRNFKDIINLDTDTWRWGSFSKEDPLTHKKKYFDPNDPFPLNNVIFYWDVAYFYYGRSRKKNGIVPRSFEIVYLQSPVTIDVTRHVFSCESGQQSVNETHKHAKVKSQLLLQ